jgi:SSS family solute:Na+ symporter
MIGGALAMLWIIVGEGGGGGGLAAFLQGAAEGYNANIPPAARPSALTVISLVFMTSFGTWGLPQMTQKFYAIRNERVIPKAVIATTLFAAVIGFSAYAVGSSAHIFFTAESVPKAADGRVFYDQIVPALLAAHLPEVLLSLILLFVLSASMSTLSSLVMISSSAIAIDLYPVRTAPATGKERATAMMRFLSLLFIIVSYFISRFQISIIVYLMSLSWGAVSGAFAAPYIYGLYWKRATKAGAYAGLAGGLVIEIVLFFVLGSARSPLAASIAIIAPFAIVPLVSVFTRPPDKALIKKAFS